MFCERGDVQHMPTRLGLPDTSHHINLFPTVFFFLLSDSLLYIPRLSGIFGGPSALVLCVCMRCRGVFVMSLSNTGVLTRVARTVNRPTGLAQVCIPTNIEEICATLNGRESDGDENTGRSTALILPAE